MLHHDLLLDETLFVQGPVQLFRIYKRWDRELQFSEN